MTPPHNLFRCLRNPVFARLYAAQTINLIGDAFTWLGLALLAFELGGEAAGTWLATALTLRVTTFVLLAPVAGVLADRCDRKALMLTTHLVRMVLVALLPWIHQGWQLYTLVLLLSVFHAVFTPTYTAALPQITTPTECSAAIALSSATHQLLSVLGPGLAGTVAAFVGTAQVFFLDALTFLLAALLIAQVPTRLLVPQQDTAVAQSPRRWLPTPQELSLGSQGLWRDPVLRYGLLLQLVAAIAGAEILVNTVGYVQGTLGADSSQYGWVMAAFGGGATLAAVVWGYGLQALSPILVMSLGAGLAVLPLLPANHVPISGLILLWAIAGVGKTLINVPTQALIAQRVALELQGRVYGAQFAWSHFWWVLAYPLAGWLGGHVPTQHFFYSGLVGVALWGILTLITQPWTLQRLVWGDP